MRPGRGQILEEGTLQDSGGTGGAGKGVWWREAFRTNPRGALAPPANRETAFVHAISSAGVMYTLTRNCSLGDFDSCGCDDSRNGQLGE